MSLTENRNELSPEWGIDHFDPWDRRITYDNIWEIYRNMRETAPVVHSDALGGFWCVTRHEEVRSAARDPQTFSSNYSLAIGKQNWPKEKKTSRLIETDPPQHTLLSIDEMPSMDVWCPASANPCSIPTSSFSLKRSPSISIWHSSLKKSLPGLFILS